MHVRVITWNTGARPGNDAGVWRFLDRVDVDIALLQDTSRPPRNLNALWREVDGRGTAIVARNGYSLAALPASSLLAAEVDIPGADVVTAVSVDGVRGPTANGASEATANPHVGLQDLAPLRDTRRVRQPMVLGGTRDVLSPTDAPSEFVDLVAVLGLTDCLAAAQGELARMSREGIFASRKLRLVSCAMHDTDEARALSDRCPVIAEFDV